MMAECLSKCEILLEELVRGEEESDRLRRLATAERENWQRLFDVMPLACVLTDAQGIVRGVNRAGALLLNISCQPPAGPDVPALRHRSAAFV